MTKKLWTKIGRVAVDSGTLMIGDPCYLIDDNWSGKDYDQELVNDSSWDLFKQLYNDNRSLKALIFSSGFGDGVYDVFAKIKDYGTKGQKDKRIKEIKIKFIDD